MLSYKAKVHYKKSEVAKNYDSERFLTWHGRLAHDMESRALKYAVDNFFTEPGTVLDVPCGTGRLLDILTDQSLQVVGGDISKEMLSIARGRFMNNPRFLFQKCDVENLPFTDNAVDFLLSFRLMCHLPKDIRRAALEEMIRVTRHVLVINYHFDVKTPLMMFNKLFRKGTCSPYPLLKRDFRLETEGLNVDVCEIRNLSWYERSSNIVIMRKR
jgi:ubiquinone/menaquinone biosynthesis C-methylase UbiE